MSQPWNGNICRPSTHSASRTTNCDSEQRLRCERCRFGCGFIRWFHFERVENATDGINNDRFKNSVHWVRSTVQPTRNSWRADTGDIILPNRSCHPHVLSYCIISRKTRTTERWPKQKFLRLVVRIQIFHNFDSCDVRKAYQNGASFPVHCVFCGVLFRFRQHSTKIVWWLGRYPAHSLPRAAHTYTCTEVIQINVNSFPIFRSGKSRKPVLSGWWNRNGPCRVVLLLFRKCSLHFNFAFQMHPEVGRRSWSKFCPRFDMANSGFVLSLAPTEGDYILLLIATKVEREWHTKKRK